MLKFGGTRPDAAETADGKDRKPHRHQRALASAMPGVSGVVAGAGALAGGASSTPTPMDMSQMQQMAPPDVPFGGQPPVRS